MNKALGVAAILSGLLVSCIGVVPLPKRTVSQNGRIANVDLAFVETGHTTREEIAGKLQSTDTGYKSDRFFIGRWRTSGWGEWFAAAAPGAGGGVSADRIWQDTNLLVEFNQSGAVQHYETFPDSLLLMKLAPVVPEQKLPIDAELEVSILFGIGEIPANLVLSPASLEMVETKRLLMYKHRPQYHYPVPVQEFRGVVLDRFQNNVEYLATKLVFSSDLRKFHGPRGKKVPVQLTIPQLLTVLAYASEHGSKR